MMGKRQYHYLIAGLPDIEPEGYGLSFKQTALQKLMEEHCHAGDYDLMNWLLYPTDNENLIQLLFGRVTFSEGGLFSRKKLQHIVNKELSAPEYMMTFLKEFHENRGVLSEQQWRIKLIDYFHQKTCKLKNNFLRNWFRFDLKLRNLLIAINMRKLGVSPENELIPLEDFTEQLINQNNRTDFGGKDDDIQISELLNIVDNSNLLVTEKYLDNLRWKYLEQQVFFEYFSIDRLLCYYLKLGILNRWQRLDDRKGEIMLNKMLDGYSQQLNLSNPNTM